MVNLKTLRKTAAEKLIKSGNDSPLADIDCVLQSLGFTKKDIILGTKNLDSNAFTEFSEALNRLKSGEPVQHIVGGCEFMSLWFNVTKDTLIPRCDTEILVEEIIGLCQNKKSVNIFEIGSGSGCIAISLAHYLPQAKVISADISASALAVARDNARTLGVSDRVTFIEQDITKGFPDLDELPDVVVSNPPYIPHSDIATLDKKVREFEPISALDGGNDGLDFYRLISQNAILKKGGILAFEAGINQAESIAKLMSERFTNITIKKDLSGIDRVVTGTLIQKTSEFR